MLHCIGLFFLCAACLYAQNLKQLGFEHFFYTKDTCRNALPDALVWAQSQGFATLLYRERSERLASSIYHGEMKFSGGIRTGAWKLGAQISYFENNNFFKATEEDLYTAGSGRSAVGKIIVNKEFSDRIRLGGWVGSEAYPFFQKDNSLSNNRIPQQLVTGFTATFGSPLVNFFITGSHTPESSGEDTLFTRKSRGFRTIRHALFSENLQLTGSTHVRENQLRGSLYARIISSARFADKTPSMNLGGQLNLFGGALDWQHTGSPWMPGISGQYSQGGGYAAGYDASGIRFVLVDSITTSTLSMKGKIAFPYGFNTELSGSRFRCDVPMAFLKAAPFSSWAMFDPVEFHLRNGFVEIREIASTFNYQTGNKTLRLDPSVTLFYNSITSSGITKDLKTLLFIPYYANIDTICPVSLNMLMGAIGCRAAFSLGEWSVESTIMQNAIPMYTFDKNSAHSQPGTAQPENPGKAAFKYGGLYGWVGVTWEMPDRVTKRN